MVEMCIQHTEAPIQSLWQMTGVFVTARAEHLSIPNYSVILPPTIPLLLEGGSITVQRKKAASRL